MFFVFLGLAIADLLFLLLWMVLGFLVQGDFDRAELAAAGARVRDSAGFDRNVRRGVVVDSGLDQADAARTERDGDGGTDRGPARP